MPPNPMVEIVEINSEMPPNPRVEMVEITLGRDGPRPDHSLEMGNLFQDTLQFLGGNGENHFGDATNPLVGRMEITS